MMACILVTVRTRGSFFGLDRDRAAGLRLALLMWWQERLPSSTTAAG